MVVVGGGRGNGPVSQSAQNGQELALSSLMMNDSLGDVPRHEPRATRQPVSGERPVFDACLGSCIDDAVSDGAGLCRSPPQKRFGPLMLRSNTHIHTQTHTEADTDAPDAVELADGGEAGGEEDDEGEGG